MTAIRDHDRDDARIEAQARDWLLRAGEPGAAEGCAAWRAADPRHDAAWRQAQFVWAALGRTAQARKGEWRTADVSGGGLRRAVWPVALAASLAAAMVVAGVTLAPKGQRLETQRAQTQTVRLDDGSRVFLGGRSKVDVRMTDDARQVVLKDGEAFFEVAHDGRPFTVIAGDAVIRVTGTKFDVRRSRYGVQVAVLEGRVEVRRKPALPFAAPPARPDRVLTGGQQVRLERGEDLTATAPAVVEPGAWRQGRMLYADAPLKEIVADANRYADAPIRLGSDDIGDLKVTVSFRPDSVGDLVSNLDQALPIRAELRADGGVTLQAETQAR